MIGWLVLSKQYINSFTETVIDIFAVSSLSLPFVHGLRPNNHYLHRLVVIFLTFSPIFVLLTISYEGLFYFAFCTTLITWVRLEHHIHAYTKSEPVDSSPAELVTPIQPAMTASKNRLKALETGNYRALTLSDARIALFFFFLLQSAFFGTGNIASLSSFSLDSVYRLIPVFNPFSQGALLILKLMIPFAIISANLGILNRRLGVAPSALFMVVMAISDVLTLNFFYMVKDEGSWLDIGTTISHFCIASLLCVFVAGLEFLSEVFISGVEVDDDRGDRPQLPRPEKGSEGTGRPDASDNYGAKVANGVAKGHGSGDAQDDGSEKANGTLSANGSVPK